MSPYCQGIQVGAHLVPEFHSVADIIFQAAIHPWFCHRIVRVGGVNGKSGLEYAVLNPSEK